MQDKLAQIQNLKIKYRNSFSAKKVQVDNYIKLIKQSKKNQGSANNKVFIDLYEYMHKLTGSSGMYGYADIAKLAREVMALCISRNGISSNGMSNHGKSINGKSINGKSVDSKIVDIMSQLSNLLERYIKG